MRPIIFCNTGWMKNYAGASKDDPVINGGNWPREHGSGEICNFVRCPDGYVYGYVESGKETKRGTIDLRIDLTKLGADRQDDVVDGVDVVWTATPKGGGRRVVGWYKNATIFRSRRYFSERPRPVLTAKHRRLESFRIRTVAGNEELLSVTERKREEFCLKRGVGWMGQQQWWFPDESSAPEVRQFIRTIRRRIGGADHAKASPSRHAGSKKAKSGGASLSTDKAYRKYVAKYEVTVLPVHRTLQDEFRAFCKGLGYKEQNYTESPVDACFLNRKGELLFAEVKPCDPSTVRYAVRTAMGQLLDYSQVGDPRHMVIVLGAAALDNEIDLALSNGFAIAFKKSTRRLDFEIRWP